MIDSLCLSADYWSSYLGSTSYLISHTHQRQTTPRPFSLDFVVDFPNVAHHGVGTSLQGPGGQGQSGAELIHVGGLHDGCQSVGAPAQQEVTEGVLDGGHIRREEGVLNLEL